MKRTAPREQRERQSALATASALPAQVRGSCARVRIRSFPEMCPIISQSVSGSQPESPSPRWALAVTWERGAEVWHYRTVNERGEPSQTTLVTAGAGSAVHTRSRANHRRERRAEVHRAEPCSRRYGRRALPAERRALSSTSVAASIALTSRSSSPACTIARRAEGCLRGREWLRGAGAAGWAERVRHPDGESPAQH